jgi:hypothetical protein
VASSGNLAHLYFTHEPGRMTAEAIETRCPGLIAALARHAGIGAVIGRSAEGHTLLLGADGQHDLDATPPDGRDLLAEYGPRAVEALRRLTAFTTAGDLILLGSVDAVTGEVTGFEELVGSHGGLGGRQTEPFILCPASLRLTDHPPLGAPALYRQLVAWRDQLQGERRG